jgi:hypothetical protein
MGSMIGSIVGEVIDLVGELRDVTRENIAKKLRVLADRIERGDIIPDEALARARARQKKINAIRDSLPDA